MNASDTPPVTLRPYHPPRGRRVAHPQRARSAATPELTSDVSIAARPFFESVGFRVVREQHPVKEGVELTNYRMRKVLSPSATAAS
ncbi:hypothetical protein [Microbacterium sp. SMR1]|uniref:hypothetical protein n=1 Tax=Microbacterium sp. SMR1 TaxID=1497340 RepID=UPI000DCD9D30|nr:hypothetical protein [Microbacterium sp. SMR1]RAZ31327.1 hypothetical protein DO944_10205 [Microbacterium sp. SMR1]